MARGRADRAPVERAALLRLGARAPARHRRADRRRQRRAARRLRQVPARRLELARRDGLRADAAAAVRAVDCRGVVPTAAAPARTLRPPVVPRDGPRRRRRCSSTTSRRSASPTSSGCSRRAFARRRSRAGAYAVVARLLQRAERQQHAARSAALRRHQDLPGRAADEAGPDEHGDLDREPRAVPRSQAGGVRRRRCPTSGSCRASRPSASCARR